MATDQELESKFIGDICIPLNHGKLSPNLEGPIGEPSEESGGNNVVERIYRASLSLKDYFTNILISLVVQMSFTRNKVNGSSKIATKFIECDNNGIKSVTPQLDEGVSCNCRNGDSSRCSMYKVCKGRCPNVVSRENNGLPIIPESTEEQSLEDSRSIIEWINKKRAERADDTRKMYLWYQHLLSEKFSPLIHGILKAHKLSLNRLKRWIITMRPNLRSLHQEQDVDVVLGSFYPPWYDTIWLSKLIERLEQHLNTDLEIKQSLLKFNSGVDHYFSKRAFVKGSDSLGEPVAMVSIDHEWQYPAHDFHLIYGRVVKALEQVSSCSFGILFCTVLKEYVVEHKINSAIIKFKEAITDDIKYDNRFKSPEVTSFSNKGPEASMLVVGKVEIAVPDLKEGCSCAQLEVYLKSEPVTLPECYKSFNGCYGP